MKFLFTLLSLLLISQTSFTQVTGCNDVLACNYDDLTTIVDNSLCEYPALNADCNGNCIEGYVAVQGSGNGGGSGGGSGSGNGLGQCQPIVTGCTTEADCNYDELANVHFDDDCIGIPTECETCETNPQTISFTKEDMADFNLAENQDRITDNVWITRGNSGGGLYNIAISSGSVGGGNSTFFIWGTEWAQGTIDDEISNLTFGNFGVGGNMQNLVSSAPNWILHILEDDSYHYITFTSWSNTYYYDGTGFSYTRTSAEGGSNFIASNDIDDDGFCDQDEIEGCTDNTASNYNQDATEDDGSCVSCTDSNSLFIITKCDSYDWNETIYTESGTYTYSTTNSSGCDSTATLNLTINNATTSSEDVTYGSEYNWNGETYTSSGEYIYETIGSNGCDSTATLYLTIAQTTAIPDPIFEQALIDLEYDDVLDGSVATANINTITILDVGTQSINDLTGIEDFTSLEDLNCKGNNLTSLNVTNLTSLQFLGCHYNNLSTLDVSSLSSLSDLNCGGNNLTSLDLTNNTSLQYLTCNDNNLSSLDLSSCTLLESASISSNENLYCVSPPEVIIFIDNNDVMSGMQGSTLFDNDEQVTFSSDCSLGGCLEPNACNIDNSALFNDGNLCIYPTTNDIYVFSYEYYEWNGETYNQTGIFDQTFTSILTGCDSTVSLHLVALVSPFETFPEVFYITDESYLLILDELETISGAGITTENTFNPSTAGLGEHTLTVSFDASQLNEEAINTIVETSVIVNVVCNNETSSETAVSCANYLWNETNYTESGTYTYFTTSSQGCDSTVILNLTINNSTEVIAFFSSTSYEFDDISYNQSTIIEQNFTSSLGCDSTIIISITIGEATTLIPDTIFEQELIDLGYDDVLDGSVATANINPVINLYVDDLGINDLTGIEAFTSLKTLECYDNNLTSLDVSNLIWLTDLDCDDNNLTSLELTNCTSLTDLDCDDNNLTSLDLTNCTLLEDLECDGNNLTSLDVSNLIWLTDLDCDDNNLTSLDLTNCTLLEDLDCDNNNLTSLDLTNCTLLEDLECYNNDIISLDLTNCTLLEDLECYNNDIISLDLTNCTSLQSLECEGNNLTSLDLTNNTLLQYLYCNNNYLTSLDLTQSTNLEYVSTYNNPNLYCVSVPTLEDMSEPSNNNFDQPSMGGPGGPVGSNEYSNIGSIQFSHDLQLIFSLDCSVGAGCLEPDACNTDESATYNDGNLCGYPSTDSLVVYNYTSYEWNGTNYSQSGLFEQNFISSFGCDSTVFIDLTILDSPFQLFPETFYTTDSTFQFSLLQEETISGPGVNDASFSPEAAGLGTHTITSNFSKAIAISGGEYSIDTNATFGYIDISEVGIELSISNSDDDYSDYLALGFDFKYWGENVDSFQVVSNGWITFDDSQNDDYNIGLPVEDENSDNSIFLIDVDLDPSESDGTINYATIGEAPNRIFVLEFDSVAYYNDNDVPFSSQLHLYETSNRIEIHTATADNYANGNDASQGLQSPDQDVAFVVPGRDDSKWLLIDDVVAFEFFNIYEFANAEISADVNVITIDTSFQDITACASFEWNGTTYSQNGTYTYETNSSLGYDSVAVLNLSINPNPEQLSISQRWSTTFQTGESFAYQWYLNGEEMEGETSDYCNFTQGGTYTVEAIDSLTCKTMSEEFVIGSLDRVFTSEMDFMLYPNPTNQFLNIELQEELGTEYIIVVSDLTGRALVNFDGSKNNTLRPFIDLNNLAKGSYQVTVKYSNSLAISKTVIKN